jgi:hypothetical protein
MGHYDPDSKFLHQLKKYVQETNGIRTARHGNNYKITWRNHIIFGNCMSYLSYCFFHIIHLKLKDLFFSVAHTKNYHTFNINPTVGKVEDAADLTRQVLNGIPLPALSCFPSAELQGPSIDYLKGVIKSKKANCKKTIKIEDIRRSLLLIDLSTSK